MSSNPSESHHCSAQCVFNKKNSKAPGVLETAMLEEAIMTKLQFDSGKPIVSVRKELRVRSDGRDQIRFHCHVNVANCGGIATGSWKKEVKQAAMLVLLDNLANAIDSDNNFTDPSTVPPDVIDEMYEYPVGVLQEICSDNSWPPPGYITQDNGPCMGELGFAVVCRVQEHRLAATGPTKEIAKGKAALKMARLLLESSKHT